MEQVQSTLPFAWNSKLGTMQTKQNQDRYFYSFYIKRGTEFFTNPLWY